MALPSAPFAGCAAAERTSFNVAWTIYVGWMPWDYADQQRHPEEMGRQVRHQDQAHADQRLRRVDQPIYRRAVRRLRDDQHGHADHPRGGRGRLDGPDRRATSPTATTGSCSKGKGKTLADIKGQKVNLVELSVSHYLLGRARSAPWGCASATSRSSTPRMPTSSPRFGAPATTAVVTWKPQLSAVLAAPQAQLVFDSSKIPGEILDLDGRQHRDAHRQSEARQGAGRRLVRDARAHAATTMPPRRRRPRSRWPRPRAPTWRDSIRSSPPRIYSRRPPRRTPSRPRRRARQDHGPGAAISPTSTACSDKARASPDVVGIQFPGGRRSAIRAISRCASIVRLPSWPWTGSCSGAAMRRLVNQRPGQGRRARSWASCRSSC